MQPFTETIDVLEPHCTCCDAVLKYGETTKYDDRLQGHKCVSCGEPV